MQIKDSKRFFEIWDLWVEFETASHFATRCKIAEKIHGRMGDKDEKAFYEAFRNILATNTNKDVPVEFRAFAVRTDEGDFHIFFMDEDSLPIDYSFNVPFDDVIETFETLVYRFDANKASVIENGEGIMFHRRF